MASCRAVRRLSNHIWETRQNAELYRYGTSLALHFLLHSIPPRPVIPTSFRSNFLADRLFPPPEPSPSANTNTIAFRARTFGAHSYGQNTTIGTTGIDIRKEQEVRIEMDGYTNTNTTTSATVAVQSVDHATTGTDGKSFMDLEAQSHHDADAEDREIEFAKMKAYKPPEQW